MQHSYSRLGMHSTSADAAGAPDSDTSHIHVSSTGVSSSRAARAAALAMLMPGSGEGQPNFRVLEQLPAPNSTGDSSSSFACGVDGSLLQQAMQHCHSAALAAALPGRLQQQQQQLVQQAAIAAGNRMLGEQQLQQAVGGEQQVQALLDGLDVQLLQLLRLREQIEPRGSANTVVPSAAAVPSAGAPALPNPAYMMCAGGSFDACCDASGLAAMPLAATAGVPGNQALLPLQLPAADTGDLLQLHASGRDADSASKFATIGVDAAGQPPSLLHSSDPCLDMHRSVAADGSSCDQQSHIGNELPLAGQGAMRQARVSEVQQKLRLLEDVQSVSGD
uniref:Uncharacterized protein n=1 Tax=Tetradesmus obliquus TaxID=3088 RepID=A0A383VGT9_TETOB|eukprot:jgi/Sobl393_1/13559/SZX63884.1